MEPTQTSAPCEADERSRWVFTYRIEGDLRFISHADTLRMFRRALARAALPVRFSGGFNPLPRVGIPLPRPVGIASEAEDAIIEFEGEVDPEDARQRLAQHVPQGLCVTGVRRLNPGERLLTALVRYRFEPEEPVSERVAACVPDLLARATVPVERKRHSDNKTRTIDIRPYIASLQVDGHAVEFTLRVTPDGTAKPGEIAALMGYETSAVHHRIRRMEVTWQ